MGYAIGILLLLIIFGGGWIVRGILRLIGLLLVIALAGFILWAYEWDLPIARELMTSILTLAGFYLLIRFLTRRSS